MFVERILTNLTPKKISCSNIHVYYQELHVFSTLFCNIHVYSQKLHVFSTLVCDQVIIS